MLEKLKELCKHYQTKFSFGSTSAIITNLALIVGLYPSTNARTSIIGGILVIALADNISDSLGIHIYQESERIEQKEVWLSTITNFMARLLVSLVFIAFLLFLPMKTAAICSFVWGFLLLSVISYFIARNKDINPFMAIFEHVMIAVVVILASNYVGKLLTGFVSAH